MKIISVLVAIFLCGVIFISCYSSGKKSTVERVVDYYQIDIAQLAQEVDALLSKAESGKPIQELQKQFKNSRYAYKKIEWLAEYYQPYTARFINGPALEEVEPDAREIIIQPEGFQVIEEILFPNYHRQFKEEFVKQVKLLRSNVNRLAMTATLLETTDSHIFDALRLQLFRIISLGISGYDSPVAQNSIPEAAASIKGIEHYLSLYLNDIESTDDKLFKTLNRLFAGIQTFLLKQKDFASLERMQLIKSYLNPLSEKILSAQNALNLSVFKEPRMLKAGAKNLFAANIFEPDYYAPGLHAYSTEAKINLGARLFYDPVLSNGSRSCASCHQPGKAFTDGLKTNFALNGNGLLKRNTPSLLNAALQPALFYDTRVSYLEDQAKAVINNKDEMHGSMEKAVKLLKADRAYEELFKNAYHEDDISEQHIKNAIAAYVRSLIALDSRFDQFMRGDTTALNKTEIEGFNLFMGKAKCGTCHFAPLFNGAVPPNFTKIDAEVLGVPATVDTLHAQLDSDEGKYYLNKIDLYRFAFKTPTVRNSAMTAPYMHNGIYNTLEEVMNFYNRGGGIGLGLPIENQTLPGEKLNLTAHEKKAIVAFLQSLNDTTLNKKGL